MVYQKHIIESHTLQRKSDSIFKKLNFKYLIQIIISKNQTHNYNTKEWKAKELLRERRMN